MKKIKEDAGNKAGLFTENKSDLGFKVYTLEPSNFKIWRRCDRQRRRLEAANECVCRSCSCRCGNRRDGVGNTSQVGLRTHDENGKNILDNPSDPSIPAGHLPLVRGKKQQVPVFSIADDELLLALENIKQEAIDNIIAKKPKRVITLDRLFAGNDQLKTNTALQMKDAGIEFRTI